MADKETRTLGYRVHLPVDVPLGVCTFQITTRADEKGVEVGELVRVAPAKETSA